MLTVKVIKAKILPVTLQKDSLYFVENGTYAEAYFTDKFGNPKKVGNSIMIQELSTNATADKTYLHDQGLPSVIWVINHNLGKKPSVTVIDSANTECEGLVKYVDNNNIIIFLNN